MDLLFLLFLVALGINARAAFKLALDWKGMRTTVDFVRPAATGSAIAVAWYVAEFTSGVSVQRGTTVVPSDAPLDHPLQRPVHGRQPDVRPVAP